MEKDKNIPMLEMSKTGEEKNNVVGYAPSKK